MTFIEFWDSINWFQRFLFVNAAMLSFCLARAAIFYPITDRLDTIIKMFKNVNTIVQIEKQEEKKHD